MPDAHARRAAIKQASHQVRTGGAFIRRASAVKALPTSKVRPANKKSGRDLRATATISPAA
jgi:hypothetical protein